MTDVLATFILIIMVISAIGMVKDLEKYTPMIGTEYNLNGLNLIVVDYSFINGNFTLSNGVKVDESLIKK